jgi:hypothetical protein
MLMALLCITGPPGFQYGSSRSLYLLAYTVFLVETRVCVHILYIHQFRPSMFRGVEWGNFGPTCQLFTEKNNSDAARLPIRSWMAIGLSSRAMYALESPTYDLFGLNETIQYSKGWPSLCRFVLRHIQLPDLRAVAITPQCSAPGFRVSKK